MDRRIALEWSLWLVSRAAALLTLGLPLGYYIPSDLTVFSEWARDLAAGTAVVGETWQYPPGFGLLLAAIGWTGSGYAGILILATAADMVIMFLLRRSNGAMLWALTPLLMGPIMLTRLDVVVTLTAILGLTVRSPALSGVWLGIGASLKVWPGVLAPTHRRGLILRLGLVAFTYAAATFIAARVLALPAFVSNQRARGLQVESLAAWPFMVARAMGFPVTITARNGTMEINTPAADSIAAWLVPMGLALTLALLAWCWVSVRTEGIGIAALESLAVVLVLLVTSRVLSPQFLVWPLGLCALALVHRSLPRPLVGSLALSAVMGQLLYPFVYLDYLSSGWIGLLVQTLRLAALVTATLLVLRELVRARSLEAASVPHLKSRGASPS